MINNRAIVFRLIDSLLLMKLIRNFYHSMARKARTNKKALSGPFWEKSPQISGRSDS
jgi:hypothetical protein